MAVSWAILKLGSQFFGRCRFLRIENFHYILPKSIWAFFRVLYSTLYSTFVKYYNYKNCKKKPVINKILKIINLKNDKIFVLLPSDRNSDSVASFLLFGASFFLPFNWRALCCGGLRPPSLSFRQIISYEFS